MNCVICLSFGGGVFIKVIGNNRVNFGFGFVRYMRKVLKGYFKYKGNSFKIERKI